MDNLEGKTSGEYIRPTKAPGATELVKQLREKTQAGVMDCHNALKDSNYNLGEAEKLLKKRGYMKAQKKVNKPTSAGVIGYYVHFDRQRAAVIELRCETDFVARMPEFIKLADDLARHIVAARTKTKKGMLKENLMGSYSETVGDVITAMASRVGENIQITDFSKFSLQKN